MKLPKSWTTVTTLSKILALAMFVGLPFIGFYFGKKYQKNITNLDDLNGKNIYSKNENNFDTNNNILKSKYYFIRPPINEEEAVNLLPIDNKENYKYKINGYNSDKETYLSLTVYCGDKIETCDREIATGVWIININTLDSKKISDPSVGLNGFSKWINEKEIELTDNENNHTAIINIETGEILSKSQKWDIVDYYKDYKLHLIYGKLPLGWTEKRSFATVDWLETEKKDFEILTISKGDYKIFIGGHATGVAPCIDDNYAKYTELTNSYIGKKVLRTIPSGKLTHWVKDKEIRLDICSDFTNPNDPPQTMTTFGLMFYTVPINWNDNLIREMDAIVESIRPL